jgi:fatty acid desaturase
VSLQSAVEIALAVAALALLGRDLYRAWRDGQRRPMTLLVAGLMVVLLAGVLGALGLTVHRVLLVPAVAASVGGFVLLWLSHRREPRPWRADDVSHYERRAVPRAKAPDAS